MKKKPAIGICDLGASGGKIFVASMEKGMLEVHEVYRFTHSQQSFIQTDMYGKKNERCCWNMGLIYDGILNGLRSISAMKEIELKSFGVDSWGSDGVWINNSGDVLNIMPTGRDQRWQNARREIFNIIKPDELFKLTGIQSHPFNVLNQIYWYSKNQADMVKASASYLPVNSLFLYYLCGKRIAEYTWMSTTQLCSAGLAQYDKEVFRRLKLPLEKMPKLVMPGTKLGLCHEALAESLRMKRFEVIVPATHDTACAYAAADTNQGRNTMVISTGTWFLAGMKLPDIILSKEAFMAGFANEAGCDSVRFLTNIMGTWPAQQLRKLWSHQDGKEMTWTAFDKLAADGRAFNCVLDIDDELFFDASNMEKAIIKYCIKTRQAPPKSRKDFARAVYEGLAMKVAITSEKLGRVTGKTIQEILILGGASHSAMLNQWFADASAVTIRAGGADATAAGNALIQALTLKWVDSIEQGRSILKIKGQEKIFEPKQNMRWLQAKQKLMKR